MSSPLLTPAQAETLIEQHLSCLPIESLPLTQAAGAVLRENIYAERDQPPFDRVAMDGIALSVAGAAENCGRLRISGIQAAGDPQQTLDDAASCIEIMTGAMLPRGCDAVVPVEQMQRRGEIAEIGRKVPQPWQNVHRRGSDCPQGSLLLAAGTRLSAPEVAIAAGAGMARVRVSAQPMIVVISTGNELVEPGELIEPHQVRRSNVYGITASLRQHGFTRVADDHVPDDEARLTERLGFHLRTHDVLILSGGVSMGRMDLVPKVLE
ncbi:MAG TPA: molybdopterin molybdotransferase MoeA, partial [Steroidobacteraceae bacterium]|nr:molybdopterin molybdotransferase MoeA [Steroidobacteraceae bacterium]